MKRITIQGQPGCFHETAARCSFPGEQVEILPCDSFDQQFARMAADPTLLGIAAIENTIAGSLLPNHELLRRSSLAVIGEYKLRISHVLAALPGEAPCDIGEVHSHPIALMQCGDYLKAHPAMKVVERDDTAGSAREIAEQRLRGTAAICGAGAAELYGAPLAVVVCADRSRAWKRPFDGKQTTDIDASILTDHMMLAASALGLGSVWICYFQPEAVKAALGLPEHLEPVNILAVGYADGAPASPERWRTERIPLDELVLARA
jgi:nitroreductase